MNTSTERPVSTFNTSEYNCTPQPLATDFRSQATIDIISVLYGSTALLGFVGNFATLLTFAVERKLLRKNFNLLILNLTLSDLFVAVFDLPFQVVLNQLGYWPFGIVECALLIFCDWGMTFVSIFTLVAISIDRYWAACYIQSYKINNTRKRTLICIAIVWVVLFIIWTPVYLLDRILAGSRHTENCSISLSDRRPFIIFLTVIGYHLPTILMIFCYVRVYRVVRRDQRTVTSANETATQQVVAEDITAKGDLQVRIGCHPMKKREPGKVTVPTKTVLVPALVPAVVPASTAQLKAGTRRQTVPAVVPVSAAQLKGTRRQKKLFLSLSYIVAAYVVLWTPSQVMVDIMCFDSSLVSAELYSYINALCYFNSAINPFLYAASSVQTRQAFRKLLYRFGAGWKE